ncbi:MAG: HAD family phosphatase [Puniceicoccales bacterium]|jgi:HAD superfamily hydrolase (TIGR01509 family)|nr:HAD family phosphatase [Puniceicoccales bacterium]
MEKRNRNAFSPVNFKHKPIDGVVFDMDGLLLDTERLSMRAWQAGARRHGLALPDSLFLEMIGHRNADCMAILSWYCGGGIAEAAIAGDVQREYEALLAAGVPVKPGARELLTLLRAAGLPLGVATSTHGALARSKLERAGLLPFFRSVTGGDEVPRGKPAPDIYLAATRALTLDPTQCLAFEDSSPGALSAAAAGLRVTIVPDLKPPTAEARRIACAECASLHEAAALFENVPSA